MRFVCQALAAWDYKVLDCGDDKVGAVPPPLPRQRFSPSRPVCPKRPGPKRFVLRAAIGSARRNWFLGDADQF